MCENCRTGGDFFVTGKSFLCDKKDARLRAWNRRCADENFWARRCVKRTVVLIIFVIMNRRRENYV